MMFSLSQCETADHEDGPWRDIGPDGVTARWMRVKPAEWDSWLRERDESGLVTGVPLTQVR